MFLFGLGKLVYVCCLLINAVAVLSEDRFLARIGWGRTQTDPAFGATYDSTSIKAKSVNLIASVRTVMRIPLIVINTTIIIYELILG
ncbi:YOS1 family protein [Aspergillus novofumigatus IBT 16806]|uniref:Yos1-like protein n=1 Tax=Aspergillus novofumigatus (strain IBT 16806) TaxID=1392255 RepID=A0A2I1C4I8_ASPN1|nr:Yos1-like protein [Aspergillus novofumigatus IBT 16806]PKX92501.1 Yos1-like protein [Aspergillus novofumigatus IBT 16806]